MKICTECHANPHSTEVRGAYTVTLADPSRNFTEPTAAHSVTKLGLGLHPARAVDGSLDTTWLTHALKANKKAAPDVLAIAIQYIRQYLRFSRAPCKLPVMSLTARSKGWKA
jgi:hypothetical protein